jgi:hypothetical protein
MREVVRRCGSGAFGRNGSLEVFRLGLRALMPLGSAGSGGTEFEAGLMESVALVDSPLRRPGEVGGGA